MLLSVCNALSQLWHHDKGFCAQSHGLPMVLFARERYCEQYCDEAAGGQLANPLCSVDLLIFFGNPSLRRSLPSTAHLKSILKLT